jgi:hypothetical protein
MAFRKGGGIYPTATIAKLNIEKSTVRQLFRAVVKATDEINEASFFSGQNKRLYKVDNMAQGAEFYVQNIALNARGYPDLRAWSDLELVDNKVGWESLCVVSSILLSGTKMTTWGIRTRYSRQ